ncbi:hypothetical protein AHF37_03468 [Paragonimus kellicotti]|nr:hypothetical protein AHF37_03468 [Paragonimus kellicotti]
MWTYPHHPTTQQHCIPRLTYSTADHHTQNALMEQYSSSQRFMRLSRTSGHPTEVAG